MVVTRTRRGTVNLPVRHVIAVCRTLVMSASLLMIALMSCVLVSSTDRLRTQPYPARRDHPPPEPAKMPPHPAAPLPNYQLMTAASTGEFEPDNELEVMHEFKLHIDAGSEMCMFQKVRPNSRFFVSFKVLAGADRNVDVVIQAPDGDIVDQHRWTKDGRSDRLILREGVYSVCVGNLASRFSGKVVDFFMATYVVDNMRQHADELKNFGDGVNNVSVSVETVAGSIRDMLLQLTSTRQNDVADYYVIKNNNETVQRWSLVLCVMIVVTSALQVAFVRRLFHCPSHVTKERA